MSAQSPTEERRLLPSPFERWRTAEPRASRAAWSGAAGLTTQLLVPLVIAFLAYFIAGKLGQATTNIRSSNLGPVWPAYGIALAAFLRYGYHVWPGVAASAFLVAATGSVSAPAAAGQMAGATLGAMSGALMLRRIPGFDPSLSRLRDALGLIVFGAFGSALLSSLIGVSSLYAAGIQPYSGLPSAWLIYWLGDSTGALLVTPLVFTLPRLVRVASTRMGQAALLLSLLTAACFVVFGDWPMFSNRLHVLSFAVLPFVMWGAIGFGTGGAALSVFMIATMATLLTALGTGPFAQSTPFVNAVLLDVLFSVLSITGLTLAAVIAERERAENDRERSIREQAVMESRLHLAAIVDSSEDAIWSHDLSGVILSWNPAAQRLLGFSPAEAIGRVMTTMTVPPELRDEEASILFGATAGQRHVHRETIRLTKTGERINVALIVSPLMNTSGDIVGFAKIARDIREQQQARKAVSVVNRKLIEAQEQERARIARELHDDIGQRLALLISELGAAEILSPRGRTALQTELSGIAADIQALSHNLHSSKLELLGFEAALRLFCEEFAQRQQITVSMTARDLPGHVPSETSLVLYRILQEALHNAAKHSGVQRVEVKLWGTSNAIHLVVGDRGAGFDPEAAKASSGIGLVSMQERIKLVAGDLSIASAPERGTTIHARAPLTPISSAAP